MPLPYSSDRTQLQYLKYILISVTYGYNTDEVIFEQAFLYHLYLIFFVLILSQMKCNT